MTRDFSYWKYSTIKNKLSTLQDVESYPIIVFPKNFSSFFSTTFSKESLLDFCREKKGNIPCLMPQKEPIKPIKPYLRSVPTTHTEYVQEGFWESTNGHILRWWLIIAFIFGAFPGFFWESGMPLGSRLGMASMFLLLWSPLLLFLLLRHGEKRGTVPIEVPYTEEDIQNMRRNEEERLSQALAHYPDAIRLYEDELKCYNDSLKEREGIMFSCMSQYLSSLIKSYYLPSDDYTVIDEPPKKGRSEDLLFASLMHSIPSAVHIDTVIGGYYPDLMVSTQNNVYIDIEVDEPYDMDSKKEIHYIGCEDEIRNERIAKKEWLVIRFSEKQVMTDCASCTRIIKAMMDIIENGSLQALDEVVSLKEEIKDSRWRKEDARMMAINNYRKSY